MKLHVGKIYQICHYIDLLKNKNIKTKCENEYVQCIGKIKKIGLRNLYKNPDIVLEEIVGKLEYDIPFMILEIDGVYYKVIQEDRIGYIISFDYIHSSIDSIYEDLNYWNFFLFTSA